MKQFARHSAALLLAATLLMVGSGVNYIHYCCKECRAQGVGAMLKEHTVAGTLAKPDRMDCCAAKKQPAKAMSCGHLSHAGKQDCCTVTRLQIDLNDQIAKISINADFTWHSTLFNNTLLINRVECPAMAMEKIYPPPLFSSRQLLSLKSVLLI